jgi:hypothetical protein
MSATVEHVITPALLQRIQHRWGALLRRAGAREAAVTRALLHARTLETAQRNEIASLRARLHGLEQLMFDYAANRRGAQRKIQAAPALARPAAAVYTAAPVAPASPAPVRLAPAAPVVPAPALIASAPAAPVAPAPSSPAAAPFDPAAIVAAMLPLDAPAQDAPGGVQDALLRLRSNFTPRPPASVAEAIAATADASLSREAEAWQAEELWTVDSGLLDGGPSDSGPWFPRALRLLAAEDPRAAGRLLLQLLPAQGLVWPEDVAYTLDIADTGCLNVVVNGDTTTIKPLLNIDPVHAPVLRTDLAGLARTVTARRGWGRIGARLSGSRGRLRPLHALACAPLGLRDLQRQGVRLDPALLLRLLARAIDPAWTAGRELTVGFRCLDLPRASCFLHVSGRTAVAVTGTPPLGQVTGTLSCRAERLLELLLAPDGNGNGNGSEQDGDGLEMLRRCGASTGGDAGAVLALLRWLRAIDAATAAVPDAGLAVAA